MCVCVYVCEGAGGWFRAWVRLSTLLLFDGTQRAFIHYSWHAEGATLGQGFGKSTPEPVIMSSVHVCGGVRVCAHACVCVSLQKRLISWHCQDWAGHSDTSRKSHGARAAGKIMCVCVWEHICVSVSVCAVWLQAKAGYFFFFPRQWRGIWTCTDCRGPSEAPLSQQPPNSATKKKKTPAWSAQNLFHVSFFSGDTGMQTSSEGQTQSRALTRLTQQGAGPLEKSFKGRQARLDSEKKANAKCATKHPHLSELSNLEIGL